MCSGKILTSTPQKLLVTNSSICHYPEYKPHHQDYWVQLAEKPQRKRPPQGQADREGAAS